MAQQELIPLTSEEFDVIKPIFIRAVTESRLVSDAAFLRTVRPFWVEAVAALLRRSVSEEEARRFTNASVAQQNATKAPSGMTFERFVTLLQSARQQSIRPSMGAVKDGPRPSSSAGASIPRPPNVPHFSHPPPSRPLDDPPEPSRRKWPWQW